MHKLVILTVVLYSTLLSAPAHSHHTIDGGGVDAKIIKAVAAMPTISATQIEPLQAVPVAATPTAPSSPPPPAVAAPSASGGCVAGYASGDLFLDKIINFESSGNSCATNAGGCFGLLQACPGEPLRSACGGNPACQIEWFQANKTGGRSWATVWQHELAYGWW